MSFKKILKPTNTVELCLEAFVRQSNSIERSESICKKIRMIVDEILLQEPGLAEVKINRITQAFLRIKVSALVTELTFDKTYKDNLTILRLRMIPLIKDINLLINNNASSLSGIQQPVSRTVRFPVDNDSANLPSFKAFAKAA